jgi:hypothetical protein
VESIREQIEKISDNEKIDFLNYLVNKLMHLAIIHGYGRVSMENPFYQTYVQ